MAKITFTPDELIRVLATNALLPPEIVRAKAKGQTLHFAIKTGSMLLPFVPASVRFSNFDGSTAVFDMSIVSGRLNKAADWLDKLLRPKIPGCLKLDYPKLSLDVNKLLADKGIKAVRVKDMFFEGENFAVITENI
jgi:hypothetical protein